MDQNGLRRANMATFLGCETMSIDKPELLEDVQPRKRLSEEVIADYIDVYKKDPSAMPLMRAYDVGRRVVLTRGFHRMTALRRTKIGEVMIERYKGTMDEARMDAMEDNRQHGLRYSRDDKVVIVNRLINDPKYAGTSIAQLSKMTGFSRQFVSGITRAAEHKQEQQQEPEVLDEDDFHDSGEEELTEESCPTDRMREMNKEIEDACIKMQGAWRTFVKPLGDKHAWVRDAARLNTATQQLSSALATLRTCKGHSDCPKCDGDGCKICRHTGFLDKSTSEAANF
jgi:hypothetical protein